VEESRRCFELRQGGSEWLLELEGQVVATGGILFHYNHPYGDIYMGVEEAHRRRGLGAYFVQELKRIAYEIGSLPGARCNVDNIASRKTLQKAGFVPFAHILVGKLATP
jgi:GNAT superfamily N-acetyltransferase